MKDMNDETKSAVFDEHTLRAEIVRMWGEHGAHIDVFDHILKLARVKTFEEVGRVNAARADRWHDGFPNHTDGWNGADWSNAMCGEAGETANVVKKLRRHEIGIQQRESLQSANDEAHQELLLEKLGTEIGDTYLYLDLLAQYYGLKIEDCVVATFNRVSEREGFPERL